MKLELSLGHREKASDYVQGMVDKYYSKKNAAFRSFDEALRPTSTVSLEAKMQRKSALNEERKKIKADLEFEINLIEFAAEVERETYLNLAAKGNPKEEVQIWKWVKDERSKLSETMLFFQQYREDGEMLFKS